MKNHNVTRTNIELDDKLIQKAFLYVPKQITTKRALIDLALREYIEHHSRRDIREIRGKIQFRENYDYKALRDSEDNSSCT